MKNSRTISRPEGYQANGLHEASLNKRNGRRTPIGATTEPTEAPKADTKVMSKEDKIQEDKIYDVAQENDTMHNPDMKIGKSYETTIENQKNTGLPQEKPNEEYGYDDDKVRRSNVVA